VWTRSTGPPPTNALSTSVYSTTATCFRVLNDSKKKLKDGDISLHSSHGLHTNCQSVLVTTPHGSGAFMAGPAGPRPWNMSCTGERTGKGMVDVKDERMLHFVPPSPSLVEFITCSATVPATFQFTSTRTTLKLPLFLVAFLVATFYTRPLKAPSFP
jgi:hypothetical protein